MMKKSGLAGSVRPTIGSNPGRNRNHNRRVVLDMVRAYGPLGRTEIARRAQLTPQAVSNIVDELVGEQMLIELGRLRSGRGQPPLQFAVNPNGPMTAGVEIATDHIMTVLIDLSGQIRAQSYRPITATDPAFILPQLRDEIASIRASVSDDPVRLLGVGVVMPGPFEIEGMSSVGPATLPGWTGVDPAPLFATATGQHVVVENDATAAVVGERLYGAGRQLGSFCYLYFGVGLGLGVIQDGRPMRGAFGNAGEIGHVGLTPRKGKGVYGPAGALERFVSVFALRERLAMAGTYVATVEDIQRLHDENDQTLGNWIAMAADYLAPTVAMLENIFDPETVI